MKRIVAALLTMSIILCTLAGCNNKNDALRQQVQEKFKQLRVCQEGEKAAQLRGEILGLRPSNVKEDEWIKTTVGAIDKNELMQYVLAAYTHQAKQTLARLKGLNYTPEMAKQLKNEFLDQQTYSGKTLGYYGTSLCKLDAFVRWSLLREASMHGRASKAELVATGVIPPNPPHRKHVVVKPAPKPLKKKGEEVAMAKKK